MSRLIVGIGEAIVSKNPSDELKTFALGSCVAIVILDKKVRAVGMIHIALPDSSINADKALAEPAYFADTGIPYLFKMMQKEGTEIGPNLIIKLIGGARVIKDEDQFSIGDRNINAIKKILWKENLPVTAEDIGKNFSRTVSVVIKTGKLIISSAEGETWSI